MFMRILLVFDRTQFSENGRFETRTNQKSAVQSHLSHISAHPDRPGVYSNAPLSVAELGKWVIFFGREIVTSALNFSLLQWSVASYPDILGIVNQNTHDYIGALISIEAFTAGSATARLYSMRMIDMPKIFSDIKPRVDILRATTQANALNQQINSINPEKAFKQEELHERLVHVLATPPLNLADVLRRAHTETKRTSKYGTVSAHTFMASSARTRRRRNHRIGLARPRFWPPTPTAPLTTRSASSAARKATARVDAS